MTHIFIYSSQNLKPYIWHLMDKHKNKKIIVKKVTGKNLRILFEHFLLFNHSLKWFLMVPPKDEFVHLLFMVCMYE